MNHIGVPRGASMRPGDIPTKRRGPAFAGATTVRYSRQRNTRASMECKYPSINAIDFMRSIVRPGSLA